MLQQLVSNTPDNKRSGRLNPATVGRVGHCLKHLKGVIGCSTKQGAKHEVNNSSCLTYSDYLMLNLNCT